jgi:hypothetical protein
LSEEKPWLRNWPEGVPRHIRDYESIPVYEFLRRSAKNYPDRNARIFYGRRSTWQRTSIPRRWSSERRSRRRSWARFFEES